MFKDSLAYVSLFLAICGGDWDLRLVSLKLIAPTFSAFDHLTYRKLIAANVKSLPPQLLNFFKKGEFVVSITGRAWHSVDIDEAHEMMINRAYKTSVVRPSKASSCYIPYRTKCLENLKEQIFLCHQSQ